MKANRKESKLSQQTSTIPTSSSVSDLLFNFNAENWESGINYKIHKKLQQNKPKFQDTYKHRKQ